MTLQDEQLVTATAAILSEGVTPDDSPKMLHRGCRVYHHAGLDVSVAKWAIDAEAFGPPASLDDRASRVISELTAVVGRLEGGNSAYITQLRDIVLQPWRFQRAPHLQGRFYGNRTIELREMAEDVAEPAPGMFIMVETGVDGGPIRVLERRLKLLVQSAHAPNAWKDFGPGYLVRRDTIEALAEAFDSPDGGNGTPPSICGVYSVKNLNQVEKIEAAVARTRPIQKLVAKQTGIFLLDERRGNVLRLPPAAPVVMTGGRRGRRLERGGRIAAVDRPASGTKRNRKKQQDGH